MERELRRNQNALIITGIGMIALSVWSIIKTILFIVLDSGNFETLFAAAMGENYNKILSIVFIFIALAIDLLLRIYVGLNARKEGFGKKTGYFYLVVDAVFILVSVYNITYYFMPGSLTISLVDSIVTVIFELTSLYTAADLFYASVKVKKLSKSVKEVV